MSYQIENDITQIPLRVILDIEAITSPILEFPRSHFLKTVTKRDLARTVSQAVSSRNNTAQEAVDALFSAMREELIKGNRIEIRGFGVLEVRDTKAKPAARNPRTGEVVYVPPRRKTHFKPGKDLKEALHRPLLQKD